MLAIRTRREFKSDIIQDQKLRPDTPVPDIMGNTLSDRRSEAIATLRHALKLQRTSASRQPLWGRVGFPCMFEPVIAFFGCGSWIK